MNNKGQHLSNLLIEAITKESEIDLTIRGLKEILMKTIESTPEDTLLEIIKKLFPTNSMYTPIRDLVGETQYTTIRHLENAGIYLAGQLTYMTRKDLAKITSFTETGPRTQLLINALGMIGLSLKDEEDTVYEK